MSKVPWRTAEVQLNALEPEMWVAIGNAQEQHDWEAVSRLRMQLVETTAVLDELRAWRTRCSYTDDDAQFKIHCYLAEIEPRINTGVLELARVDGEIDMLAEVLGETNDQDKRKKLRALCIQNVDLDQANQHCNARWAEINKVRYFF
jgi:hypothetical protein